LLNIACVAAFCRWFGRRNYLAYALTIFVLALPSGWIELSGSGNPGLQTQAWMVAAVAVLGMAWAVWPAMGSAE
jgi:hypothetical protein